MRTEHHFQEPITRLRGLDRVVHGVIRPDSEIEIMLESENGDTQIFAAMCKQDILAVRAVIDAMLSEMP